MTEEGMRRKNSTSVLLPRIFTKNKKAKSDLTLGCVEVCSSVSFFLLNTEYWFKQRHIWNYNRVYAGILKLN